MAAETRELRRPHLRDDLYGLDDKRAVLFSVSPDDKIFGVSQVSPTAVTFPRPINTDGLVQFLWLGNITPDEVSLLWVEKVDSNYVVKTASAAA